MSSARPISSAPFSALRDERNEYEFVEYPKQLTDERLVKNPIFQRLVQICSVSDSSIQLVKLKAAVPLRKTLNPKKEYQSIVQMSNLFIQLQELVQSKGKKYTKSEVSLSKRIYSHLFPCKDIQATQNRSGYTDQVLTDKLVDFVGPLLGEVGVVLKNINDYEDCFPSFPLSVKKEGLRDRVEKGELIFGQLLLVDDEWESLSAELLEGTNKRDAVMELTHGLDSRGNSFDSVDDLYESNSNLASRLLDAIDPFEEVDSLEEWLKDDEPATSSSSSAAASGRGSPVSVSSSIASSESDSSIFTEDGSHY